MIQLNDKISKHGQIKLTCELILIELSTGYMSKVKLQFILIRLD